MHFYNKNQCIFLLVLRR